MQKRMKMINDAPLRQKIIPFFMKYISVLPSPVAIYDEHWKERNTFVGPYYEKDTINLVCEAVGGNV